MFDIDKLNIYWKEWSEHHTDKSKELSKLLNLERQILLHPRNAHHLMMPVVDDIFASNKTGIYGELENFGILPQDSKSWIQSLMPHTNTDKSMIFVKGKFGVGIVALDITGQSVGQVDNLEINVTYFDGENTKSTTLRFEGVEYNYSLANYIDNKGNIISETLSQLLTTQVDNVKNPVAIKLGINMQTLNVVGYLIRRGVDPNTVVKFIKQPLIQQYLENQRINESFINKTNGRELNKEQLYNHTINGYPKSKEPISITNENLIAGLKNDKTNQVQFLDYFLELQQQAKALAYFSQDQNADTKGMKDRSAVDNMIQNLADAMESQIIPLDKILDIRNNGVISPFTKARDEYDGMYRDFYAAIRSNYHNALFDFKNTMSKLQKTNAKKEKVRTTIDNDFVLYFVHKYVLNGEFDRLFGKTNEPSLASRIQELKKSQLSNNLVIKAFFPILDSRLDEIDGEYLNSLRLFEREMLSMDINDMIDAMKEISETEPKLYEDIVKFLFFQSGLNNSPFNYSKIVPVGKNSDRADSNSLEYLYADILKQGIDAMKNSNIDEEFQQFVKEFVLNNPQYLRNKSFKGYLEDYPSASSYVYRFNKTEKKMGIVDKFNNKDVPSLGSTFHKRYGVDLSPVVKQSKTSTNQNTDQYFPTVERDESVSNNPLLTELYQQKINYDRQYKGEELGEFTNHEYYRYMIEKLAPINPNVMVQFYPSVNAMKSHFKDVAIQYNIPSLFVAMDKGSKRMKGAYLNTTNEIGYSSTATQSTLLHELVHGTVQREYNKEGDFYKKINELFEYADKQYFDKQKIDKSLKTPYGFSSPTEFLAEALSNPEFMQILNEIPYTSENKTLWTKLVELIGNMLNDVMGIEVDYSSTLGETIREVEKVIAEENKTQLNTEESDIMKYTIENFDTLFPQFTYMEEDDRKTVAELVEKGEIKIECKFG